MPMILYDGKCLFMNFYWMCITRTPSFSWTLNNFISFHFPVEIRSVYFLLFHFPKFDNGKSNAVPLSVLIAGKIRSNIHTVALHHIWVYKFVIYLRCCDIRDDGQFSRRIVFNVGNKMRSWCQRRQKNRHFGQEKNRTSIMKGGMRMRIHCV